MQLCCQSDKRWAEEKIGSSELTLKEDGCTTCCLSMISSIWGNFIRPDILAANKDWYTDANHPLGAGLILWNKIQIPNVRFLGRKQEFDEDAVLNCVKDPNKAAMIQVLINSEFKHWTIAVRRDSIGWRVADPLSGAYRYIPKNWKPIGCALFCKS